MFWGRVVALVLISTFGALKGWILWQPRRRRGLWNPEHTHASSEQERISLLGIAGRVARRISSAGGRMGSRDIGCSNHPDFADAAFKRNFDRRLTSTDRP
jgi:hypothetical protein